MEVITPGHVYLMDNMEIDPRGQLISFIQKEEHDGKFVTVKNGTTNEEVLAVLIDRIRFLNTKAPCEENAEALAHLDDALGWLNKRSEDRRKRGVENTPKP